MGLPSRSASPLPVQTVSRTHILACATPQVRSGSWTRVVTSSHPRVRAASGRFRLKRAWNQVHAVRGARTRGRVPSRATRGD